VDATKNLPLPLVAFAVVQKEAAAVSIAGRRLVRCGDNDDDFLRCWDVSNGQLSYEHVFNSGETTQVHFNSAGSKLWMTVRDGSDGHVRSP
jgi:hypothetical protein